MLQQLESMCEALYKSADQQQRHQSEQARDKHKRAAARSRAFRADAARSAAHHFRHSFCAQMLRPFGTNTEYIPQCKAVLDASINPYAQLFAASSLVRLLTENTLSSQVCLTCAAIWPQTD